MASGVAFGTGIDALSLVAKVAAAGAPAAVELKRDPDRGDCLHGRLPESNWSRPYRLEDLDTRGRNEDICWGQPMGVVQRRRYTLND